MRDQSSPSPVYTSFIHPLSSLSSLSSSSSSSSRPLLLPPPHLPPCFLPSSAQIQSRSVGRSGHDFITRRDLAAEDHSSPLRARRARSLAGPFFKSHSAPPRRAEVGIRPSTMSFFIHSYPYPVHPLIRTEECSTRPRLPRTGLSVLQLGVCLTG